MKHIDYKLAFERIKSTDFPLACRGMYYFSKGRHDHQERKSTGMPYYVHPRGVAFIVMMAGGTVDQINAALGHDLLEDTDTSFVEIAAVSGSMNCAAICSELRNNTHKIADIGKSAYMDEKIRDLSDDALTVKLADMLYNMSDYPAEGAMKRMRDNYFKLMETRLLNETQRTIADQIGYIISNTKGLMDDGYSGKA